MIKIVNPDLVLVSLIGSYDIDTFIFYLYPAMSVSNFYNLWSGVYRNDHRKGYQGSNQR